MTFDSCFISRSVVAPKGSAPEKQITMKSALCNLAWNIGCTLSPVDADDPAQASVAAKVFIEAVPIVATQPCLCEFVLVLKRGSLVSSSQMWSQPSVSCCRQTTCRRIGYLLRPDLQSSMEGEVTQGAIAEAGPWPSGDPSYRLTNRRQVFCLCKAKRRSYDGFLRKTLRLNWAILKIMKTRAEPLRLSMNRQ